jgi:hypothetical protein
MATFYLNHESELYHYGVKGMKWGRHSGPIDYIDYSLIGKKIAGKRIIENSGPYSKSKKIHNKKTKQGREVLRKLFESSEEEKARADKVLGKYVGEYASPEDFVNDLVRKNKREKEADKKRREKRKKARKLLRTIQIESPI